MGNFLNRSICCGLLMGLVGMPDTGIAEVYKWVDEQGQTHYGERPGNAEASKVIIEGAPDRDTTVQERQLEQKKMLKVYEEERNIKKEEKLKAEAERRKRDKLCAELKNNLQDYRLGRGIYYELDENGKRKYIADDEMKGRVNQLQERYDQECT